MPANLPPEYFEAEKRYRSAKTPSDKVACLEELLALTPKHKGTDKLRADLRKRISKMKAQSQVKKSLGKRESAFRIDREGAGQVVIAGPANVGKSALLAALTNAAPEVAPFPYTTWKPTPGMMQVENIQIQLIDTPPLNRDYVDPELLDLIRKADMIVLMVDLQADPLHQLEDSVDLLAEHRILPVASTHGTGDGRGLTAKPFLVLANKNDDAGTEENFEIFLELIEGEWLCISASVNTGRNMDLFGKTLYDMLKIVRVYSKSPGKKPDLTSPFVLKEGARLTDFAGKIHKDFAAKLKSARVWGSAVYDGQLVQRDYILRDGDVVELQI